MASFSMHKPHAYVTLFLIALKLYIFQSLLPWKLDIIVGIKEHQIPEAAYPIQHFNYYLA